MNNNLKIYYGYHCCSRMRFQSVKTYLNKIQGSNPLINVGLRE